MNHPPLHELVAQHVLAQQRRGIAAKTIRQRRYRIRSVARDIAPVHVLDATTETLARWLDGLDVARSTRATYTDNLRAFYDWARRAGHIPASPAADLETPKVIRRLPRPIVDDDLADALDRADPRMLAILSLMAYEGLRCVEVSRLRGEDVDTRAMTLSLHGKGDRTRVVPLHPHTLAALEAYRLPDAGPIFVRHWGKGTSSEPIGPSYVGQLVSAHLPRHWTAHKLRHWFGTHFYQACHDILLTQEVMGHSRPETTSVYARADVSKAAAVVGALAVGR